MLYFWDQCSVNYSSWFHELALQKEINKENVPLISSHRPSEKEPINEIPTEDVEIGRSSVLDEDFESEESITTPTNLEPPSNRRDAVPCAKEKRSQKEKSEPSSLADKRETFGSSKVKRKRRMESFANPSASAVVCCYSSNVKWY